ncbi:MAG: hypothetical protein WC480_01165 [Patescibacteria group bacterium]
MIHKIENFFEESHYIWYFFIFILAFFVFGFLQSAPRFMDPDSFYHAKMAVLLRDQGVVTNFPWLPWTVLNDYYIDQHFLYHVFLLPFVTVLNPLVGIKLATAVFAALFLVTFYWFLKKNQVNWALIFTLFLFLTKPLVFRINLAKVPALSLIFLLIGFYFIVHKRYWFLFLFSFFYVYLYGGWPLILVVLFFYLLVSVVADYLAGRQEHRRQLDSHYYLLMIKKPLFDFYLLLSVIFNRAYLKLVGSCLSGLAVGLIFNPYFPKNFRFYWYQLVQIGVINFRDKVRVGMEWLPYSFQSLLLDNCLLLILLLVAMALFVINIKKQSRLVWVSFLLSLFFLIITFKSQRYIEYFIPFAVIYCALVVSPYLSSHRLRQYSNWWQNLGAKKTALAVSLGIFWFMAIVMLASKDLGNVWYLYQNSGIPLRTMEQSSQWLANNVSPGEIIFHSDWDEFPLLFYYNSNNNYIAGLDPTFMYSADPKLYKLFEAITVGNLKTGLATIIQNDFKASYVLVNKTDHQSLKMTFESANHFEPMYEDDEAKIYQISL